MLFNELNKFKDVVLDERDFKIRSGDQILKSPSSLWRHNTVPFDDKYWSTFVALQRSGYKPYPVYPQIGIRRHGQFDIDSIPLPFIITPEYIQDLWFKKGQIGMGKGNFIHPYIQNRLRGRIIKSEYGPYINSLDSIEVIKFHQIIIKLKEQCANFIKDYDHLIPICAEKVVGSRKLGVGGIVDDLLLDEDAVWIVDYKTDHEIKFVNNYGNKGLNYLSEIDDCNYNKYRHQLSWYKKVIQTETNINIKGTYVVWFCENNDNYQVLEIPYMTEIDSL